MTNGTSSNCPSYADGEDPSPTDQPGTIGIKFTLGGIIYNFRIVDQQGNFWRLKIFDISSYRLRRLYVFTT